MNPFLTSTEIAMMRADYEQVVRSPEACRVRIQYRTWADQNQTPDTDPVYRKDVREVREDPVTVSDVTCLQQIVKPKDTKFLASNIVEVGDCIFWFSDQVNLDQPDPAYLFVPGSLILFDVEQQAWVPKPLTSHVLLDSLILRVGNKQIGQPLPCQIKK